MKKNILFVFIGAMLILNACEPIEKRHEIVPILTADQLSFSASNKVPGGNWIILQNNTPGTTAYWDWGSGTSNKSIDTIILPFKGTFNIKFTAFCANGTVTDSTKVTVAQNDDAYFDTDPAWKTLTAGGSGQTWVWALDHPSGNKGGNGPENCVTPAWWTVKPGEQLGWGENDEVYMDLVGAANFVWKKGDGSQVKGFFKVITKYTTFSAIEVTGGASFPWPTNGKYHFTKLTADELSVHEYAAFNVALYKRKGFVYTK
jgi:hypothetical protein